MNPLFDLLPTDAGTASPPQWRWGTVQNDGKIILDADSTPFTDTPSTLVALKAGDRVFVQIYQRRAVVLGKAVTS